MMVLRSNVCGKKIVKPRKINKKASVTIKLGSPVLTTIKPFNAPQATQITKASMIASQTGQPNVTLKIAIIIPANPIMEPTERSNSPAIINRHAPTAMIINWAETTDQLSTPAGPNMPLSNAVKRKKVNTKIVPHIPPSSGRIRACRMLDMDFMRSSPRSADDVSGMGCSVI